MSYRLPSTVIHINNNIPLTFAAGAGHLTNMNNVELVLACQRRERGALECLFRRHESTIKGTLHRLGAPTDNSDMLQETFIRVWKAIPLLRNPAAFKGWLKAIVTNLYYDQCRKRSSTIRLVSMDAPYINSDGWEGGTRDIRDSSPQPDDQVLAGELSAVLTKAISRLTEQFRTALILRDIEGLSYLEIATITHTELGTVKSRITRARHKVQELIAPYLERAA